MIIKAEWVIIKAEWVIIKAEWASNYRRYISAKILPNLKGAGVTHSTEYDGLLSQ
ncbi:MAG: hypothetical protein FWH55_11255 [Oscillospiraceae bacterium]|nr:hypothetical protein [Oscillospiraceae bacterium]